MADPSLNKPVVVQATRIDASILPRNIFSRSYLLYVINQGTDVGSIAEKANQAGGGAYDAQVRNDEQDVILDKHEKRITKTEEDISGIKVKLLEIENDVNGLKIKVQDIDGKVSEIIVDYVSLSRTGTQTLTSSLSVSGSYSVNGTKVVGARQTGWTAATGTANKGVFNADLTFTVSDTYTQSEIQAIANALIAERRRTKALEDALRAHGLIN
ncbi:phage tail protein [Salmonella enterica]|nr:phage tail protein [Salmonella enterica]EGF6456090.1 phage tail protein [Salmonella enterica]EGH3351003.1 phage tail protein [Salmonella enterica]EGY8960352.1 phage tail protein [Salmonella enterica]EJH2680291.1 phage tail protein [Salmonella enterica]